MEIKIGNTYKLFIPAAAMKILSKSARRYHEKIVLVLDRNEALKSVLVSINQGATGMWVESYWVCHINADGNCGCDIEILVTKGCKCSGN